MAFTAEAIIANIESRLGQNGSHVWSFYKLATGTAWCAGEVSYTFNKTGNRAKIFGGKPVFYVPTAQIWMANNYQTIYDYRTGGNLANARKGDIVIFMWTRGSRDHIGFVRATGTSSTLFTVEGNTSGHKVANRTREKKNIYAVYRPPYGNAPSGGLDVDGQMGPLTIKAFQKWLGVNQTGTLNQVTIKAFQKRMNIPVNGNWDERTRTALQRYLNLRDNAGLVTDGVVGYLTVCALQRWLNKVVK